MTTTKTEIPSTRKYCLDDDIGFVELIGKHEDPGLATVNAARTSYGSESESFTEGDKKLTGFLWNHEHTSPFRHAYYTFHVKVPLFTFRQWVKYQVGSTWRKYALKGETVSLEVFDVYFDTDKGCSWNELSGRYKELKPEFYVPGKLRSNVPHGNKQASDEFKRQGVEPLLLDDIHSKLEKDYEFYRMLLEHDVARELARCYLPQAIYTQAYWTVSLQGILWFLHQRLKSDAQFEIRSCAEGIYNLIESDLTKMGITKDGILQKDTGSR